MDSIDWGKILGLFLGGGLIGAFFTFILGVRKQNQSEFVMLIDQYKGMVTELSNKYDALELKHTAQFNEHTIQIKKLEKLINDKKEEIVNLRNQLMIFESGHTDIPVPIWLKDTRGIMLFINREYGERLLKPIDKNPKEYIGKTDIEFWGKTIGTRFRNHDIKVMRNKQPIEFIESWPGYNNIEWEGRVIKYPRFGLGNKTVIGIGGIVVDMWEKGTRNATPIIS